MHSVAKNIVEYRARIGSFKNREELKKVSLLGPKAFEQCAGFLRIPNASNPLDNSAVHPESYKIVEEMAAKLNCSVIDLIQKTEIRKEIKVKEFISETTGQYTIEDILKELEKPGRDPRSPIEEFRFADGVSKMDDLKPGMKVPGIITNITNFGAFVDVGVKQDGLVHISHLSNRFITDPNEAVKLNQKVMVTVLEVDAPRKRISLSLKEAGERPVPAQKPAVKIEKAEGKRNGNEGRTPKPVNKKPQTLNPFQAKLMELKKNFKD